MRKHIKLVILIISMLFVVIILAPAVLLGIGNLFFGNLFFGNLFNCSTQVVNKSVSPDGRNVAYFLVKDCGVTAGSNELAVDVIGQSPTTGNVFACEDRSTFKVKWKNAKELIVYYPKDADVYEKKSRINSISIDYVITDLR